MAIGRADAYDDKSTVSQFDFEEVPTDHGWSTYDLDGKSTYYFGSPRGWYMSLMATTVSAPLRRSSAMMSTMKTL